MRSLPFPAVAVALCIACTSPGSGPVVRAPPASVDLPAAHPSAPRDPKMLTACALPWTLEDVEGGAGRVVVVCGSDVRRRDVEPGVMIRALDAALEPARERVCSCAGRMTVPAYVDLVVTSKPDDGQASVVASEPDDELDPALAAAFVACIGTLQMSIAHSHADTCGNDKATFVYPLHVDLER